MATTLLLTFSAGSEMTSCTSFAANTCAVPWGTQNAGVTLANVRSISGPVTRQKAGIYEHELDSITRLGTFV